LGKIVRWLAGGLIFMGANTALLYRFVHYWRLSVPPATSLCAEACALLRHVFNDIWVFRSPNLTWVGLWQYHVANAAAFVVWRIAANVVTKIWLNYVSASILAVGSRPASASLQIS
jgi:putative flippase GtrA